MEQKPDMSNATPREIAEEIVRLLWMKGARDIRLYAVTDDASLTDFHLLATGRSATHVKSLADDIDYEMSLRNVPLRAMEGRDGGAWILLDFLSVIVHIFDQTSRDFYHLERLWKQENEIDVSALTPAEPSV